MKPENGSKKRTAKRNNVKYNKKSEESEETEQFIPVTVEQSWREAVDIIATEGSIKLIAV